MIALVPARLGEPVAGSEEAVAECSGRAVVVGEHAEQAASVLAERTRGLSREISWVELGAFRPASWAARLAPLLEGRGTVVLPASPDGRDLAPRLARELDRPLLAGAIAVDESGATVVWRQGRLSVRLAAGGGFVATLLPGSRSVPVPRPDPADVRAEAEAVPVSAAPLRDAAVQAAFGGRPDADPVRVVEADPSVIDLAESSRIIAAGAGIGGRAELELLQRVASRLGASVGGTRVVTDAGLLPHDRQIGTTGVSVRPRWYVALGISGAAQHVGGVAAERIVAANLDPSCPMMAMADLALVTDARELLRALDDRLGAAGLGDG
ncbi:MAG: mycofactocin-associated electron transfer flavoprotein alpha subunit [Actinomycetota bacterium]|jgi:electron transfer flavoprotein alpha subunit|nr:mycofactocin-associated electron transfer flavoprotein alpha subunit [Actinomycetota bacterium]